MRSSKIVGLVQPKTGATDLDFFCFFCEQDNFNIDYTLDRKRKLVRQLIDMSLQTDRQTFDTLSVP